MCLSDRGVVACSSDALFTKHIQLPDAFDSVIAILCAFNQDYDFKSIVLHNPHARLHSRLSHLTTFAGIIP